MLKVEDLHVKIGDKEVLKGINLSIGESETFILFGPNGSGKTTFLMTLMGFGNYDIVQGRITFRGEDITHAPIYERARLGIGMSFQRPPTIHGLKTRQMVSLCGGGGELALEDMAERVNFADFLDRDVNAGLSGGEIKRSELLQLMAQKPDLLLFDEPESGVDLENIALVGQTIAELLQKDSDLALPGAKTIRQSRKARTKMGLIITHTGYILDYLEADKGYVLYHGVLSCGNNPREILHCVGQFGYEECVRCTLENN